MLLRRPFGTSPVAARVVPFLVFLALTLAQSQFGETARYWLYLVKTLVGAWMIWEMRPWVAEMRWAVSAEAIAAGIGVFALWVGFDGFYPHISELGTRLGLGRAMGPGAASPWNPLAQFGAQPALAWFFVTVRLAGASLVVPPLEEVFFRSFLYRYISQPDFQSVPTGRFRLGAFVLTSAVFAFEHEEWLSGLLCGFTYQALVLRKQRLGDAITAHAITNVLLGLWVVGKGAWHFW